MKTVLKSSLLFLVLSFAVSPKAHADGWGGWWWNPPPPQPPVNCDPPKTAPEVDPSMAFAGLSLLGGTLTVVRSRRRK